MSTDRGAMHLTKHFVVAAALAGSALVLALWNNPTLAEARRARDRVIPAVGTCRDCPILPPTRSAIAQMLRTLGSRLSIPKLMRQFRIRTGDPQVRQCVTVMRISLSCLSQSRMASADPVYDTDDTKLTMNRFSGSNNSARSHHRSD